MFTEIEIKNYKSIREIKLSLGRVNVFIGENGAGKSNILEVIALAAAAAAEKLDHEFLSSRGIRVTTPEFMRPAFPESDPVAPIEITARNDRDRDVTFLISNDNAPYSKWTATVARGKFDMKLLPPDQIFGDYFEVKEPDERGRRLAAAERFASILKESLEVAKEKQDRGENFDELPPIEVPADDISFQIFQMFTKAGSKNSAPLSDLAKFVIYSPENSALRVFDREGQIEPLGINGEGLLKLLSFYAARPSDPTLDNVKKSLKLFDWFENFETESVQSEARLLIRDRYLKENANGFDHKGTNEGFFFLLFYFLLFNSNLTPDFFAIDNIDASLNPKLCEKLMRELARLAKQHNKQAIFTTHNPAVLDGLNLGDDEQRLFVVSRSRDGATKIKRIKKPEPVDGNAIPRLSELFIRGLIGGLPKGF